LPFYRQRKVDTVAEEASALAGALARCGAASHRRAAEERTELFHRGAGAGPDTSRALAADYDAEAAAYASASRANGAVEDLLDGGARVLVAMGAQRERLKAAHRKALDVLHATGLSDALLRAADRRQRGDAALVYGGMATTTLLFVGLVYWLHR
jgi:Golgi SNAP receptor complex protein 2